MRKISRSPGGSVAVSTEAAVLHHHFVITVVTTADGCSSVPRVGFTLNRVTSVPPRSLPRL